MYLGAPSTFSGDGHLMTDPPWAKVYYVVDTVVDQLLKDEKRHFIYVEVCAPHYTPYHSS
jgi:hypothetical protein